MIILNTSFHLLASHETEFVDWAKNTYIPAAKKSGLFGEIALIKILTEVDPAAKAYAIQLKSESMAEASRWHDDTASLLKDDLTARWGEEVVYFTTYMEQLDL